MIPVAIYARYSTDEQDPRSIEDQTRRCTEYGTRNRYDVVAEFADAAVSGAHTDRAQLRRMIDIATSTRRPPFRAVLVDDLSRLSRNMGDFWRVVDDLAGAGVHIIDVQTGMSSDDPNARMVFGAKSLVNDQFLQMVRYQTHRGLDGRARAGFSTGGSLYGYRTVAEDNPRDPEHARKRWVIDEDEAKIVRRIVKLIDEGKGYRAVADLLNREDVEPPRNNGRGGKHGGGWSHMTVRAIVTNEKYVGRFVWNTHKWTRVPGKRARRRTPRPESEHVVTEMAELAIVDRALWDRMQARMVKRQHGSERTTRKGQQTYLTSGLLRCGVCGGPMSVRSAKVKNGIRYVMFGCTAHSSRGGSICTNSKVISEIKITTALINALREVLTGPEVAQAFARAFERRVNERSKQDKPADLARQLDAARKRVSNATRLMVEMPDDLDIRRQREHDKAEVRRLELELAAQKQPTKRAIPDRKALGAAVGKFLDVVAGKDPARGREVLARVLPQPLKVTPKIKGASRFEVTGSIDLVALAAGAASGSSGGRI